MGRGLGGWDCNSYVRGSRGLRQLQGQNVGPPPLVQERAQGWSPGIQRCVCVECEQKVGNYMLVTRSGVGVRRERAVLGPGEAGQRGSGDAKHSGHRMGPGCLMGVWGSPWRNQSPTVGFRQPLRVLGVFPEGPSKGEGIVHRLTWQGGCSSNMFGDSDGLGLNPMPSTSTWVAWACVLSLGPSFHL